MACQGLSPQTIKVYLAGIRHMQISIGLPDPKEFTSMPRLRMVQSGIQRYVSEQDSKVTKIRLPITPTILLQMRDYWLPKSTDPDVKMLWAAAIICFFGFFRSGEITVPSTTSFNPKIHLAWGDVSVDDTNSPTTLRIRLKTSKTDQLGNGVDVYVGRTDSPLCPVGAGLDYMAARGFEPGPFFRFSDGSPLTKSKFTQLVRDVLQTLGLPYTEFAGHSFRIGAATAAAKAGMEDSVIRSLGRWNSSAFLVYLRTPRDELAQCSKLIATV